MHQPVLRGYPKHTQAKIAESQATQHIDPAKQGRVNPAASPADYSADGNAPEHRAKKEAHEEKRKLPASHARSHHAASQARPERESNRIGQTKHHASREIAPRGGRTVLGSTLAGKGCGERQPCQAQ